MRANAYERSRCCRQQRACRRLRAALAIEHSDHRTAATRTSSERSIEQSGASTDSIIPTDISYRFSMFSPNGRHDASLYMQRSRAFAQL